MIVVLIGLDRTTVKVNVALTIVAASPGGPMMLRLVAKKYKKD